MPDVFHAGFQVSRKLVLGVVLVLNDKLDVFLGDPPLDCGDQFCLTLFSLLFFVVHDLPPIVLFCKLSPSWDNLDWTRTKKAPIVP